MNGAFLRRRDQTVRSLRVEHYSSAVNTSVCGTITATAGLRAARPGVTVSRRCRAATPPTASCGTETETASSANRRCPAPCAPDPYLPIVPPGRPPIRRSDRDAAPGATFPDRALHKHSLGGASRVPMVVDASNRGRPAESHFLRQQARHRRQRRQQPPARVAGQRQTAFGGLWSWLTPSPMSFVEKGSGARGHGAICRP